MNTSSKLNRSATIGTPPYAGIPSVIYDADDDGCCDNDNIPPKYIWDSRPIGVSVASTTYLVITTNYTANGVPNVEEVTAVGYVIDPQCDYINFYSDVGEIIASIQRHVVNQIKIKP